MSRKLREIDPERERERQSNYRSSMAELRANYDTRTKKVTVSVPRILHDELVRRKIEDGLKTNFSDLVSQALYFGLFGAHPYDDPVEGVKDAFEVYSSEGITSRQRLIEKIRRMVRAVGVHPEELIIED
jgi:transcriptional regulator of met regulon